VLSPVSGNLMTPKYLSPSFSSVMRKEDVDVQQVVFAGPGSPGVAGGAKNLEESQGRQKRIRCEVEVRTFGRNKSCPLPLEPGRQCQSSWRIILLHRYPCEARGGLHKRLNRRLGCSRCGGRRSCCGLGSLWDRVEPFWRCTIATVLSTAAAPGVAMGELTQTRETIALAAVIQSQESRETWPSEVNGKRI